MSVKEISFQNKNKQPKKFQEYKTFLLNILNFQMKINFEKKIVVKENFHYYKTPQNNLSKYQSRKILFPLKNVEYKKLCLGTCLFFSVETVDITSFYIILEYELCNVVHVINMFFLS